jgi:hypothetical protein
VCFCGGRDRDPMATFALAPWAHWSRGASLLRSMNGVKETEDAGPLLPRRAKALEISTEVVLEDAVKDKDRRNVSRAIEHLRVTGRGDEPPAASGVRHLLVSARMPLDLHASRGRVVWLYGDVLLLDGTLRVLGAEATTRLYALVLRGDDDEWVDVTTPNEVELFIYDVARVLDE